MTGKCPSVDISPEPRICCLRKGPVTKPEVQTELSPAWEWPGLIIPFAQPTSWFPPLWLCTCYILFIILPLLHLSLLVWLPLIFSFPSLRWPPSPPSGSFLLLQPLRFLLVEDLLSLFPGFSKTKHSSRAKILSDSFLYLQHPVHGLAQELTRVLYPFPTWGRRTSAVPVANPFPSPFLSRLLMASLCHLSFLQRDFWSLPFLSCPFS